MSELPKKIELQLQRVPAPWERCPMTNIGTLPITDPASPILSLGLGNTIPGSDHAGVAGNDTDDWHDDDDFSYTAPNPEEEARKQKEQEEKWLIGYGLDEESLLSISAPERIARLVSVLSERISNRNLDEEDYTTMVDNPSMTPEQTKIHFLQETVAGQLINALVRKEIMPMEILDQISYETTDGLKQIQAIQDIVMNCPTQTNPHSVFGVEGKYVEIHVDKQDISEEELAGIIDLYTGSLQEKFFEIQATGQTNYLVSKFIEHLVNGGYQRDMQPQEFQRYVEIAPGRAAVIQPHKISFHRGGIEREREVLAEQYRLEEDTDYVDSIESDTERADEDFRLEIEGRWDSLITKVSDVGDFAGINMVHAAEFKDIDPRLISDYIDLQNSDVRSIIEREFNISLHAVSIREQSYFLQYLKNTTVEKAETMQSFTQLYGVSGMRTFLALSQTNEITGDQLVAFGVSGDLAQVGRVFSGYSDLLDQKSDIDTFLATEFTGDEATRIQIATIAENKLQKNAAKFLVEAVTRPDTLSDVEASELIVQVEKAAGLAAAVSAALRSRKITNVDTFQSFRQDILSGHEVRSSPLFQEMLDIYEKNYTEKYDYSPSGRQALLDSFTKTLEKDTTQVYVWRIGDTDVLTYLYADEYPEQQMVYIGGLNSNPAFQDARAGKGLIEQMLRDYDNKKYTITAEAAPANAIAYMKLYGFVATDWSSDPDEAFVLSVARQADWKFTTQDLKDKEFINLMDTEEVYESPDQSFTVCKLSPSASELAQYFANGYVMTRMIQRQGIMYAVMEQAPFVLEGLYATDSQTKIAA
jgi:hypothetical protein